MFGRATGLVECRGARRTSRFPGPVTLARTIRAGCGAAISILVSNLALMTLNCTGPGRPSGYSSSDIELPTVIPRPTLACPGRIGPPRNPMPATRRDAKSACHA